MLAYIEIYKPIDGVIDCVVDYYLYWNTRNNESNRCPIWISSFPIDKRAKHRLVRKVLSKYEIHTGDIINRKLDNENNYVGTEKFYEKYISAECIYQTRGYFVKKRFFNMKNPVIVLNNKKDVIKWMDNSFRFNAEYAEISYRTYEEIKNIMENDSIFIVSC